MKVAVIYNKKRMEQEDVINVFGPPTKEHYSPKTVEKVASALEKGGHNVKVIDGNINVADELKIFMPRVIAGERPGMVFNMAYGIQGQSRYTHIPAMLEMLGVPYVGSSPSAHAIALDKVLSKVLFQQNNLPTPGFWVFSNVDEVHDEVIYPIIVKPKMEAVSFGLRVVNNKEDLIEAVRFIIEQFSQQALVEQFIAGREFAVGVLGNRSPETLPIVEIDLQGDPNAIQTVDDKMKTPRDKICPAQVEEKQAQELRRLAVGAFNAIGLNDFCRVDFRMDTEGNIFILEINSMASLGSTGSYVHSAKVAGYNFNALINRMLDVAAIRYFGETYFHEPEKEEAKPEKTQPLSVRVRGYLRSQIATMEDYLQKMIEMNTYAYNIEGVNTFGKWMSQRLGHLGFQRQVYPSAEAGNILYFTNHTDEKNDILLLGHLDTAYNYQNYVYFREERGRYYGSGVAESKGGLVVLIAAIQALRFTRVLKRIRCGILLTGDETIRGKTATKIVEDMARQSQCVLGLKYGDENGGIVQSTSGSAYYDVEITCMKKNKVNAPNTITMLCQKVLSLQKLASEEKGTYIGINSLNAHAIPGLTPDHAFMSMIARFNEKDKGAELDNEIRSIAKKGQDANIQIQVTRKVRRNPSILTEGRKELVEKILTRARKLEVRVKPVHRNESSFIAYVPEDVPALDGFGPIGSELRSSNEYIIRDSLIDRAALLALTIYDMREQKKA
jgi:D-alanine-D-alanine ligase